STSSCPATTSSSSPASAAPARVRWLRHPLRRGPAVPPGSAARRPKAQARPCFAGGAAADTSLPGCHAAAQTVGSCAEATAPEVKPDSAETASLLERVAAGDRAAVGALLERHRPDLVAFVEARLDPRLRARVDPSDVVQEAQLEAARRMDDFLRRRP